MFLGFIIRTVARSTLDTGIYIVYDQEEGLYTKIN